MKDPETPEQSHNRREKTGRTEPRAPFDTSELDNIPRATDEDPPYQNWWVVTDQDAR